MTESHKKHDVFPLRRAQWNFPLSLYEFENSLWDSNSSHTEFSTVNLKHTNEVEAEGDLKFQHLTGVEAMFLKQIKSALWVLFLCDDKAAYISPCHLCFVLSLLPGWMRWFSSLAWRMRSASRQSTITFCAYPATGTQLRSQWSSLEHKVFALRLIESFVKKLLRPEWKYTLFTQEIMSD